MRSIKWKSQYTLIAGVVLLAIVAMAVGGMVAAIPEPVPPTPTLIPTATNTPIPTATLPPTTIPPKIVTFLGGGTYVGASKQFFLETKNIDLLAISMGSGQMIVADTKDPTLFPNGVDCVWPATNAYLMLFKRYHPELKILKSETIFYTDYVFFTTKDKADAIVAAGYAKIDDQGRYIIDLYPFIQAALNTQRYGDMGINDPKDPAFATSMVRFETSDWINSGGGFAFAELAMSVLVDGNHDGARIANTDDLAKQPDLLDNVVKLYRYSGFLETDSIKVWSHYQMTGGVSLMGNYVSGQFSLYNQVPVEERDKVTNLVGMYPINTIKVPHILACFTPAGVEVLNEFVSNPDLQKIGTVNGMETRAGSPGTTIDGATWYSKTVYPNIPEMSSNLVYKLYDALFYAATH